MMMRSLILLFFLAAHHAAQGKQPQDTVAVKGVEDTVQVEQTEPVRVEQDNTVRMAMIVMPFMMGLIGLVAGWQAYLTEKLRRGQNNALTATNNAATKAETAAKDAAKLVAVVETVSSQSIEGIRALIVSNGKIHDLVDGNLTAYKELVNSLVATDAGLRRQLRARGIEPDMEEVDDIRMHPKNGETAAIVTRQRPEGEPPV